MIKHLATEYQGYSSTWKFAGTIDRVTKIHKGKFAEKIAIIDIKTGTYLHGVEYQMAGYQIIWNETNNMHKATVRLCVQLIDGKYKVYPYSYSLRSDIQDFLVLLQSYKIKHKT